MLGSIPIEVEGYFASDNINNSDVIVDAGAYPGDFSIMAAKKYRSKRIIALEPNPQNMEYGDHYGSTAGEYYLDDITWGVCDKY